MGKQSRRRRRKRKSRQKALARRTHSRISLSVVQLEVAKGHDGFLRGAPEPTLVVGLFRIDDADVRLLGRYLYRFERPASIPAKVSPREPSQEFVVQRLDPTSRVVVLALAAEEDSGRGLQHLYAELEHGEAVMAWTDTGEATEPEHLPELAEASLLAPARAHRVHLMFEDRDPSVQLAGDDWVDANLLWTANLPGCRRYRFHFVSPDGRNDWTAELDLTLGSA